MFECDCEFECDCKDKYKYNVTPEVADIWAGIGGHFDSITQVICEFVDNSISNLLTIDMYKQILISIDVLENSRFKVIIEDTGSGINDLGVALKIGDRSQRMSSLNEHGFGLKHALATADTSNDSWRILTRTTEEYKNSIYREIKAPYEFKMNDENIDDKSEPWPGKHTGSGTIIEFTCSESLFKSVVKGIGGKPEIGTCLKYLRDDLGYIYSGYIKDNGISIQIFSGFLDKAITVKQIEPYKVGEFSPSPNTKKVDLGEGGVDFSYKFLDINDRADLIDTTKEIKGRYYRRNQRSQGLEIRVNGRLMMDNMMDEIWGISHHPGYNHFLAQVNIESDDTKKLPKTRTSKNGLRIGDEKLDKIISEVHDKYPKIDQRTTNDIKEKELVERLRKNLDTYITAPDKNITTEFTCFDCFNSKIRVDLYVYDGRKITIYEAKKDNADIMSLYQLRAYWDGLCMDTTTPDEGILISSKFSDGVDDMILWLNNQIDPSGNNYKIRKVTWRDMEIKYPV